MKKKYDDIKNLFDDVEQSSSENPVENGTRQNETSLSSGSNYDGGLEFLEKILGVIRQIENLQGRCADIQKVQENILKRLDDYKDMKVGLSPNDKAILTKLPGLISQQVNQNVGEAAENVKVAISKHTESTLKSVDEACDMRIKKAKRELGRLATLGTRPTSSTARSTTRRRGCTTMARGTLTRNSAFGMEQTRRRTTTLASARIAIRWAILLNSLTLMEKTLLSVIQMETEIIERFVLAVFTEIRV